MAELRSSAKGYRFVCKCGSDNVKVEIPHGYEIASLELTCRNCGNGEGIGQDKSGDKGKVVHCRDDRSAWDKFKSIF